MSQHTPGSSHVRIAHFAPDAPNVDVRFDDETVVEDLPFRTVTGYRDVDPGTLTVRIAPHGSEATIESFLTLAPRRDVTVLLTGDRGDVTAIVLTDTNRAVDDADARLRFVNASPDAPAFDVAAGDNGLLFEAIPFGRASRYTAVEAGHLELVLRPTDGSDRTVDPTPRIELAGGVTYTVFATGHLADGSLDAVVIRDFTPVATAA